MLHVLVFNAISLSSDGNAGANIREARYPVTQLSAKSRLPGAVTPHFPTGGMVATAERYVK